MLIPEETPQKGEIEILCGILLLVLIYDLNVL